MQADHAIAVLRDRTLLITPGDREDLLTAVVAANRQAVAHPKVTGIVLTGGFRPSAPVLAELEEAGTFTYLVRTDTYRTAQAVDDILVKTHPSDTEKIETIIGLVRQGLGLDSLLTRL
jgi:phosphate acetyltransferase